MLFRQWDHPSQSYRTSEISLRLLDITWKNAQTELLQLLTVMKLNELKYYASVWLSFAGKLLYSVQGIAHISSPLIHFVFFLLQKFWEHCACGRFWSVVTPHCNSAESVTSGLFSYFFVVVWNFVDFSIRNQFVSVSFTRCQTKMTRMQAKRNLLLKYWCTTANAFTIRTSCGATDWKGTIIQSPWVPVRKVIAF